MASKWICFGFMLVFSRFASGPTFSDVFFLFGNFKASVLVNFWNKFRRFLDHFWHLGSRMPQEVSRYPHDCCRMAYLSLSGPNMGPSWLQVGSSWVHLGPTLAPTYVGPISGSPAALGPTQALPNSFPVASGPPKTPLVPYKTQIRSQRGLQNLQLGP